MNIASRIRRSFFAEKTKKKVSNGNSSVNGSSRNEDDLLGVTDELIDHVRSFTIDIFKNFSFDDEENQEASVNHVEDEDNGMSSSANLEKDLSDWQEKHALLVLSKSKELSQLRFKLCPRLLKDEQFWRIYFQLVRSLVAKYELLAIQQAKIKRMAMEDSKTSKTKGVYEVEMSETKPRLTTEPSTP
ncbi:hypothetical protein V5N11_032860 [Cardamine amara subsp. amara]|uniref:BSD domain-containing protein n=1 Tax=Cardamine amara subsp. amara TaxID=228776 RepID=A0ABD0Z7B4_CARAN